MKKILYLGGNLIGVKCLELLLRDADFKIVGVLPRFSDNGSVKDSTAFNLSLRRFAVERELNVFNNCSANEEDFISKAVALKPDYIVSIQYDKILKKDIIGVPKKGCINLHFAPLPKYRGCMPIPWGIIDNTTYGASLHWIDVGIDTGPIIDKIEFTVKKEDTAFSAYMKLTNDGTELFRRNIPKIKSDSLKASVQVEEESIYHPKGDPFERWIDWNWAGEKIEAFIRAFTFPPYPSARAIYEGEEIEILYPVRIDKDNSAVTAGTILSAMPGYIEIKAKDGKIRVDKIKLVEKNVLLSGNLKRHFTSGKRLFSGLKENFVKTK